MENKFDFDKVYANRINRSMCPHCMNRFTLSYIPDEDIAICDECGFVGTPVEQHDGKFIFKEIVDESLVNEAFEDAYNNCFVEFRDGSPSFAYKDYYWASKGVASSMAGDHFYNHDYSHKYEIKYLKDGVYYDVDERGNIMESLKEDTIKTSGGKWTNKGKDGTHGKFKTKKEADAQRKAMFANGYRESLTEDADTDGFEYVGTERSGGKNYGIFRKTIKDDNGNVIKGVWKACPTNSDIHSKHFGDLELDNMFDITYDQALGRKPISDDSNVEKLSKTLGRMLLPKRESVNKKQISKKPINEKLVEPTDEDLKPFEDGFEKLGLEIERKGKTLFGSPHYQLRKVLDHAVTEKDMEEVFYALCDLEDEHEDMPATCNVGIHKDGDNIISASFTVQKKYVKDVDESLNELLDDDTYNTLLQRAPRTYIVGLYYGEENPLGYRYEINSGKKIYTKVPEDGTGSLEHFFIDYRPQDNVEEMEKYAQALIKKFGCREVSNDEYLKIINESLNEAEDTEQVKSEEPKKKDNVCPDCGAILVKDATGTHCPRCDKKNEDYSDGVGLNKTQQVRKQVLDILSNYNLPLATRKNKKGDNSTAGYYFTFGSKYNSKLTDWGFVSIEYAPAQEAKDKLLELKSILDSNGLLAKFNEYRDGTCDLFVTPIINEDFKDPDKMSKKDKKAYYSKQRNMWERNPVTKVKPSGKLYKRDKKVDMDESLWDKFNRDDFEPNMPNDGFKYDDTDVDSFGRLPF